MSRTKPDDETVITVCLQETDFTTACAKLGVGRSWLTQKLAALEVEGGYRRRRNCPLLIRDA